MCSNRESITWHTLFLYHVYLLCSMHFFGSDSRIWDGQVGICVHKVPECEVIWICFKSLKSLSAFFLTRDQECHCPDCLCQQQSWHWSLNSCLFICQASTISLRYPSMPMCVCFTLLFNNYNFSGLSYFAKKTSLLVIFHCNDKI